MKIQSTPGFDQYKKYVQGLKSNEAAAGKVKGSSGGQATANTDKVTFSEAAAAQAEIARIATAVSGEVEETGSEEKLAALSEQVADGRYFVESDVLVSSILGQA